MDVLRRMYNYYPVFKMNDINAIDVDISDVVDVLENVADYLITIANNNNKYSMNFS